MHLEEKRQRTNELITDVPRHLLDLLGDFRQEFAHLCVALLLLLVAGGGGKKERVLGLCLLRVSE